MHGRGRSEGELAEPTSSVSYSTSRACNRAPATGGAGRQGSESYLGDKRAICGGRGEN